MGRKAVPQSHLRIQKEWEQTRLYPGLDKPDMAGRNRACFLGEQRGHMEVTNARVLASFQEGIARNKENRALAEHIHVRPHPRIEDTTLIDLDDLPTRGKVDKMNFGISRFQKKDLDFKHSLKKQGSRLKDLYKKQITTDLEIKDQAKRCKQTKLREKIENAMVRRNLFSSEMIFTQRRITEQSKQNMNKMKMYAHLCKKMESQNRKLSALVISNRCLLDLTDKKLRTISLQNDGFKNKKRVLEERYKQIRKDVKYLPKDKLSLKFPWIRSTQSKSPKKEESSKVCLLHPPKEKSKDNKIQIRRYINKINNLPAETLCNKRTQDEDSLRMLVDNINSENRLRNLKVMTLLSREQELDEKIMDTQEEQSYIPVDLGLCEDTQEELQSYTPVDLGICEDTQEELQSYTPVDLGLSEDTQEELQSYIPVDLGLCEELKVTIQEQRDAWCKQACMWWEGELDLMPYKEALKKDREDTRRIYRYAKDVIERFLLRVFTTEERRLIAGLYFQTESDRKKKNMAVDLDTMQFVVQYLDRYIKTAA